jgi:hypothetical protein
MARVGLLAEAKDFFLLYNIQTDSAAHPASYTIFFIGGVGLLVLQPLLAYSTSPRWVMGIVEKSME